MLENHILGDLDRRCLPASQTACMSPLGNLLQWCGCVMMLESKFWFMAMGGFALICFFA